MLKRLRFLIFYMISFIVSIFLSLCTSYLGINDSLNGYYDFVGDILTFSSILTGFLGAVISIIASISKSSPIIARILDSKKAFRQLIISMFVPFFIGIFNILWSILFRLKLNNLELFSSKVPFNEILLISLYFFIFTSVLMTVIIFYIFFNEESEKHLEKEEITPRLKNK